MGCLIRHPQWNPSEVAFVNPSVPEILSLPLSTASGGVHQPSSHLPRALEWGVGQTVPIWMVVDPCLGDLIIMQLLGINDLRIFSWFDIS